VTNKMIDAIESRRSIRKYSGAEIPEDIILKIVEAGAKAPSAKNRQPWKFIIVEGEARRGMLEAFRKGLDREKRGDAMLPESGRYRNGAEHTLEIMRQAPVTIFVMNTEGRELLHTLTAEEKIYEIANIQSIGAAVQNMLLAATEMGIGSLWICDVFFAYKELGEWLAADGEMIAAVSFGYPLESPHERPRKPASDITEWRR
jgi:nitroreductase